MRLTTTKQFLYDSEKMEYTQSQIDTLITSLNLHAQIANITVNTLDSHQLTDEEKEFITAFTPENQLIIYGTLAPGKPNHAKIAHIEGVWLDAVIWGQLKNEGWGAALGYYGFVSNTTENVEVIPAKILQSSKLIKEYAFLDDFEGAGYQRILTKYQLSTGVTGVGYIYALNN